MKAPAVMKVPGRGSLPNPKVNSPSPPRMPTIATGATVPKSGSPMFHPNRMKFPKG